MGGLSVLRAVRDMLPAHNLWYLADTAYCPYGPRPVEEVRDRALACCGWLVEQGAEIVVVACNTASSAALEVLRAELPVPIVGMEPGVKPAARATRTRHVGVLATGGTLGGRRYADLIQRFAADIDVQPVACPGLVEQVEAGNLDTPHTRELVSEYLNPLRGHEVDTIVLGCTHFNFLTPVIAELAGPHVTIIDTAPAVARRVVEITHTAGMAAGSGATRIATTASPSVIAPVVGKLLEGTFSIEHADC
jgi:glutamate racemase